MTPLMFHWVTLFKHKKSSLIIADSWNNLSTLYFFLKQTKIAITKGQKRDGDKNEIVWETEKEIIIP